MNTTNIVKRINQLKKLSVQLKQSTEDNNLANHHNNQYIRVILKLGKQIVPMADSAEDPPPSSRYPIRYDQESTPNAQEDQDNQQIYNLKVFGAPRNDSTVHVNQQTASSYMSSSFVTAPFLQMTPTQQIAHLRNQNLDLQQQIIALKQRLKKLEQLQIMQKQQQWKQGLPYFDLRFPKAKIFYTKLNIDQKDFDKIDYSLYDLQLNLEKIGLVQVPHQGAATRPPKIINLMLTELKEVSYFGYNKKNIGNPIGLNGYGGSQRLKQQVNQKEKDDQYLIVYHFKYNPSNTPNVSSTLKPRKKSPRKSAFSSSLSRDSPNNSQFKSKSRPQDTEDFQIVQTLFIKFDSQEQCKQWDLGVYVNYKIIEQLTKPQFEDGDSRRNQGSQQVPFSTLLEKLTTKNVTPQKRGQEQSGNQSPSQTQNAILKKFNSNTDQSYYQPLNTRENNNIKIRDENQNRDSVDNENQNVEEIINKERSDTSHFGMLTASISFNLDQKIQKDKEKVREKDKKDEKISEELKKMKQIELEEQKRRQQQRMEAMRRTEIQLSIKKSKQSLRKGYNMIKYAKYSISPHEKKVYLNQDGRRLNWQDPNSTKQPKWITITDILSIKQGEFGKGIQAHVKEKDIRNDRACFVVIELKSKDRKVLELKAKDPVTMEEFCKELTMYRDSLYRK